MTPPANRSRPQLGDLVNYTHWMVGATVVAEVTAVSVGYKRKYFEVNGHEHISHASILEIRPPHPRSQP